MAILLTTACMPENLPGNWVISNVCDADSALGEKQFKAYADLKQTGPNTYEGPIKDDLGNKGHLKLVELDGRADAAITWSSRRVSRAVLRRMGTSAKYRGYNTSMGCDITAERLAP